MFEYEKKCAERISDEVNRKMQEKQKEIDAENIINKEKNIKNIKERKLAGKELSSLQKIKMIPKYTLTQLVADICETTGLELSQPMLHLYTVGKSYPPINNLAKLADYFDVSFEYLAGISDCRSLKNAKIEELLNLNYSSIQTLLQLNENKQLVDIMDALLSDKNSVYIFLQKFKNITYKERLLEKQYNTWMDSSNYIEEKNNLNLKKLSLLSSFYDYFKKQILATFSEEFDNSIEEQLNYDYARIHDENEKTYLDFSTQLTPEDLSLKTD